MKRLIIISSILIATISLLLFSCSKDQIQNERENISSDDLLISKKIKQFRTDAESNLKSDKLIDAEEAIWLMEATLNYTYSFMAFEFDEHIDNRTTMHINIINDMLLYSDAGMIYEQIKEYLRNQLCEIDAIEKEFLLVDLYLNPESETPELMVDAIFGKSNLDKSLKSVGTTDWWYWGNNEGKCGNYTGGTTDAGDKIRAEAHSQLYNYIGSSYYWDNIINVEMDPTDHPAPTGSDWPYLLFWWQQNGNWMWMPDPCLSPTDISFFVDGYVEVVEDYEDYYNKLYVSIYSYHTNQSYVTTGGVWVTTKVHEGQVKLGIKRKKEDDDVVPMSFN